MHEPQLTAVVIEDEVRIRRFLRTALESARWQVFEAETMASGITQAGTRAPDLLVLDLGLPDGDGLDLIGHVRQRSAVPIIVLSARTDESDKIQALDAGANDYLTKPFGVGEFLARARAAVRSQRHPSMAPESRFTFGDIEVDLSTRVVKKDHQPLHLTPIEFRLLSVMLVHAGKVMTHSQLLSEVWGPAHANSHHYVRVYMGHLRAKLEKEPAQPEFLLTETAVGYRFNAEALHGS